MIQPTNIGQRTSLVPGQTSPVPARPLTDQLGAHAIPLRTEADRLGELLNTGITTSATVCGQALHEDAHTGNALATPAGPRWIDFEDAWLGPPEWDLAVLTRGSHAHTAAVLAAYPDPPARPLTAFVELRTLFGVCWRFIVARRCP